MKQISNSNQRELLQHSTDGLPCAFYIDIYKENIYPWHWHDEMEAGYVQKGCLEASVNNQKFYLKEGEGIFINTGVPHSYANGDTRECAFPNILFHPSMLAGPTGSVFQEKYIAPLRNCTSLAYLVLAPEIPWQADILAKISESIQLLEKKDYGYELRARNTLSDLILQLNINCLKGKDKERDGSAAEILRMRKMLDYIHHNFAESLTVEQIASAASVSKRECLRCFRKTIASSPMQFTRQLRLQKAKHLLEDTTFSLLEISEQCGFQSQSYFTKLFREHEGISPGEYRKRRKF